MAKFSENYTSMKDRIIRAENSHVELKKCDRSLARLWDNGVFTKQEFETLDRMLLVRMIMLSHVN